MSSETSSQKAIYHLFNRLPHIYELDDMMEFCNSYEKLYIYGAGYNQENLLKYFDMCGVKIEGYVVSRFPQGGIHLTYRQLPVQLFDSIMEQDNGHTFGFILGLSDRHYHQLIPLFREKRFKDYFLISEHTKQAIAWQMRPRPIEEMTFEVNVADHCNLSCQMCDHYSQLAEEKFLDLEQFGRDIKQMGKLFGHKIAAITLLGGEPTLNPDLIRCIKLVREQFPDGELIILTNGILLQQWEHAPEGNLWQACRDYNVHITVTMYPIKLDYAVLQEKAREYGVSMGISSNIHAERATKIVKISDKHTMDPTGSVDKRYCVSCLYFNKFNVLKDGRLYMCPIAAHSGILNQRFGTNFELTEKDSIDIYKAKDWTEIAEFTSSWVPFCRYCDLKQWGPHSEWKASTKKLDEYI